MCGCVFSFCEILHILFVQDFYFKSENYHLNNTAKTLLALKQINGFLGLIFYNLYFLNNL